MIGTARNSLQAPDWQNCYVAVRPSAFRPASIHFVSLQPRPVPVRSAASKEPALGLAKRRRLRVLTRRRAAGRDRRGDGVWSSLTIIPPHFRVAAFHTRPETQVSNRDRDFRPARRRGFDDDNFEPPRRSFGSSPQFGVQRFEAPSGPPVQAVVKWYNPEKGFGFVALAGGSGDAFLHVSVVERSGHDSVPPGATLEVRAGPGPKGPQVTEILSVDSSTAQQEPPRRARADRPVYRPADQAAVEESGTVKWYNATKGFGFIAPDRGGKDIFVHASVLERAGIAGLTEGQRVSVDVIDGRKGPEAAGLRLI